MSFGRYGMIPCLKQKGEFFSSRSMSERSWHLAMNGGSPKCKNKSTSSGAVISRRKFHVELDFSESRVLESNDATKAQGLKSLNLSQRSSQLRTAGGSS